MIKTSYNIETKRFSLRQPEKTTRSLIISNENVDPSPSSKPIASKLKAPKKLPPIRSKTLADEKCLNEDLAGNGLAPPCPEEAKVTEPDESPETKVKHKRVKLPIYPNISNMAEFRKKHRLGPNQKVYVVTNGYGDIKRALDKRGWVQNQDPASKCFDLRWTIKSKDEDTQHLEDCQIVNHFEKNASITTKVGLCRNLRNLVWFCPVDINTFYPRCFDLSDEKDYEDFIEDFKFSKAESILKLYVRLCQQKEMGLAQEMEETVLVALQVSEKRLLDPDDMLEMYGEFQQVKVSEEEWKILSKDEITQESLTKKKFEARMAKLDNGGKTVKKIVNKKKSKRKIVDAKAIKSEKEVKSEKEIKSEKDIKSEKEIVSKGRISPFSQSDENNENQQGENDQADQEDKENKEGDLLSKIKEVLKKLKEIDPQHELTGDKNIWMMKPAGLSRGRGITCLRNLVEVLDIARKNANHWVVQKYIENPLIVHRRKFDIRQWVLVTDWNPLTVWFYEECYVRFSGGDYNTEDLENRFIHLTNNSVTKHMKEGEDDSPFEQNMWRMEVFEEHLKGIYGRDVFNEIIKPKMKQAVIWALESAQDMIGNRKNSFEFYGYDFMVDEDFNVWLIEINLSPAMDYSTPVTKRLVKMVSEDVMKVVIDNNMGKKVKKSKKGEMETGLFTCIHRSKRCVEKPMNSYGLELIVEGVSIEK